MNATKRRLLTIGITGGIGSGKSEASRMFEKLGVPVISADVVAKEISNYDPRAKQLLLALLGPKTYTSDGVLDRAFVASKVFSSKSIQKKINLIIHPRVEVEVHQKFLELEKNGMRMGMVEAALIYEAGLDKVLDAVVVVDASESVKIDRVMKRDGASRESVLGRMNAQMDSLDKLKKADYIIHNDGTLEELEHKVKFLHSIFQNLTNREP